MLAIKRKKLFGKILLGCLGMGYFVFFSSLDINSYFKGYVVIIPVQFLALIYGLYLYCNERRKDKTTL
jgi:lipopolysaccharide export LptBFGC system permease protein LptF